MADLAGLIEQTVTGLGYELVDFETSPRARLLRVFIDRLPAPGETAQRSGVTIEDCSAVSHQLTRLFMVENIDYDRLEVSSPGMDRPLKKPADFERFAGHEVQIKLRIPAAGRRNFTGVILGLVEDRVRLRVAGEANKEAAKDAAKEAAVEHEFLLDNVEKARLVPKF